jgi:hypothetical protein
MLQRLMAPVAHAASWCCLSCALVTPLSQMYAMKQHIMQLPFFWCHMTLHTIVCLERSINEEGEMGSNRQDCAYIGSCTPALTTEHQGCSHCIH